MPDCTSLSMQQKGVSMTISSSLNAGVAGLSSNATRLAAISDNIAVMYQGAVVRYGPKSQVLSPPFDDYTDLLLSSVPEMKLGWLEDVLENRKMESAGN